MSALGTFWVGRALCVCVMGAGVGGVPPVHCLASISGVYFEQRGTIFSFR